MSEFDEMSPAAEAARVQETEAAAMEKNQMTSYLADSTEWDERDSDTLRDPSDTPDGYAADETPGNYDGRDTLNENDAPEYRQPLEVPTRLIEANDGHQYVLEGDPEHTAELVHQQGRNDYGFLGTCGLCSCQDVLNQYGSTISENEVVRYAAERGLCNVTSDPEQCGGTTPEQQAELLRELGVPAQAERASLEDMAAQFESGGKMIIEVNAGVLYDMPSVVGMDPGMPNHAIVVTGVVRDATTGEIAGICVNDSGLGQARFVDAAHLQRGFTDTGGNCVRAGA